MTSTGKQRVQKGSRSGGPASSIAFKYYIHDTADGYSLEMSGPFSAHAVPELACCWETARTTLKNRSLTLNLKGLTSIDDAARQWLASMSVEGAQFVPESFLRNTLAGNLASDEADQTKQRTALRRLFHALRRTAQTNTVNADSVRVTGR